MKKNRLLLLILSLSLVGCSSPSTPEAKDPLYRVDFVTNGGSHINSITTNLIETEPISTYSGHSLVGWYETSDFSGDNIKFPYKVSKNTTLYAEWEFEGYTVTFNSNGGSEIKPLVCEEITKMPESIKNGFTLLGWSLNEKDLIKYPYKVEEDITLNAIWEKDFEIPDGELLASAKVSNMKAYSYWNFEYQKDALVITTNVVDEVLYSKSENIGFNDNIEFFITDDPSNTSAGFNLNSIHFLVDCIGQAYFNIPSTTYDWGENIYEFYEGTSFEAKRRVLDVDGYNGYTIISTIPYTYFSMEPEEIKGNIRIGCAMRNSNSQAATFWGNMVGGDFNNAWSYVLISENGTVSKPDIDMDYMFFGDSYYSTQYWNACNTDLEDKNAYVVMDDSTYEYPVFDMNVIKEYKPKNIVCNLGGRDYQKGKYTNEKILGFFKELVEEIKTLSPNTVIYLVSINPIKNFTTKVLNLISLNNSISAYASSVDGVNYLNTCTQFLSGSTIQTQYYANNYNLNASGYVKYMSVINTIL